MPEHHYGSSLLCLAKESLSVVIFVRRTQNVLWPYDWVSLPFIIIICLKLKSQVRCWSLRETLRLSWLTERLPAFQKLYFPQPVLCFSSKAYSTDLQCPFNHVSEHESFIASVGKSVTAPVLWNTLQLLYGAKWWERRYWQSKAQGWNCVTVSGQFVYFPVGVIRVSCYVNLESWRWVARNLYSAIEDWSAVAIFN